MFRTDEMKLMMVSWATLLGRNHHTVLKIQKYLCFLQSVYTSVSIAEFCGT
jgi:hypothetical protein